MLTMFQIDEELDKERKKNFRHRKFFKIKQNFEDINLKHKNGHRFAIDQFVT